MIAYQKPVLDLIASITMMRYVDSRSNIVTWPNVCVVDFYNNLDFFNLFLLIP